MITYTASQHSRISGPGVRAALDRGEVVQACGPGGRPLLQVVEVKEPGHHLVPHGKGYKLVPNETVEEKPAFSLKAAGIDFEGLWLMYREISDPKKGPGAKPESRRRCRSFAERTKATFNELCAALEHYAARTSGNPQYRRKMEFWWTREADADLEWVRSQPSPEDLHQAELEERREWLSTEIVNRHTALREVVDPEQADRLRREIEELRGELKGLEPAEERNPRPTLS